MKCLNVSPNWFLSIHSDNSWTTTQLLDSPVFILHRADVSCFHRDARLFLKGYTSRTNAKLLICFSLPICFFLISNLLREVVVQEQMHTVQEDNLVSFVAWWESRAFQVLMAVIIWRSGNEAVNEALKWANSSLRYGRAIRCWSWETCTSSDLHNGNLLHLLSLIHQVTQQTLKYMEGVSGEGGKCSLGRSGMDVLFKVIHVQSSIVWVRPGQCWGMRGTVCVGWFFAAVVVLPCKGCENAFAPWVWGGGRERAGSRAGLSSFRC